MARAANRRIRRPTHVNGKVPQPTPDQVSELIGRYVYGDAQVSLYRSRSFSKTIDETIPDYEFYDRLRRGQAVGYRLGGLFCKRIEQIFASWVLGRGVTVGLEEVDNAGDDGKYTNGQLANFVQSNHALLMTVKRDTMGLGDQYIIVNVDGSLSVPSPETVTVKRDPYDYRKILSATVTTRLDKVVINDEYTADRRTVTIKEGEQAARVETYPNLTGILPVIHLAYGRSANETNGHSIHEPLLPLYDQYDDVAFKQLDGAKVLGNPILAIQGLEDLSQVINANQPADEQTYEDRDGNTVTRPQLNIDSNALLLIGKGGSAGFVAPPVGFTGDTAQALKTLFWLLLDHTGIPEFIWGNQVSSGRSSSDTQMDQFVRDIEARRVEDETWLLPLCDLWLATTALTDANVMMGPLKASWPPLIQEDRELVLKTVQYARDSGLITDVTALSKLDLVDSPEDEVEAANEESAQRVAAAFPDGSTPDFQARLGQDVGTPDEIDQPGDEMPTPAMNA